MQYNSNSQMQIVDIDEESEYADETRNKKDLNSNSLPNGPTSQQII
jgi:hypothetical protein